MIDVRSRLTGRARDWWGQARTEEGAHDKSRARSRGNHRCRSLARWATGSRCPVTRSGRAVL